LSTNTFGKLPGNICASSHEDKYTSTTHPGNYTQFEIQSIGLHSCTSTARQRVDHIHAIAKGFRARWW